MALRTCTNTPKSTDGTRLLHLSDLHFNRTTKFTDPPTGYLAHLTNRLVNIAEQKGGFDLILVTGDLVDFDDKSLNAHLRAMTAARDFLQYLCRQLSVSDPDGLVIIPGNHDYLYLGLQPRTGAMEAFANIYRNWMDHRWYPNFNLLVACFDSNVDQSSLRFATGYVNTLQLADFEVDVKKLGEQAQSAYRLALVHHHLMPIATAEEMMPDTWYERLLGRKLVGTPELMLLRNAGNFTQQLLEYRFNLALHGHLHRHDSSNYQSFRQGRHELIEVIACGATSCPTPSEPCSFNVLRLRSSGVVSAEANRITNAEGRHEQEDLKTVTYEVIRAARYDGVPVTRTEDPANDQPLLCKRYARFWDVRLPAGDVISEDTIEGLRCTSNVSRTEVLLTASVTGLDQLNEAHFSATCPDDPNRVQADIQLEKPNPGSKDIRVLYMLRFTPPLDERPVTVLCRRVFFGALLSSREAHRFHNPNAAIDPHVLLHTVRWPCEQVVLRVSDR